MNALRRQPPDTLVILFWVAVAVAMLSFLVPAGRFEVETDERGRASQVALASFALAEGGAPGTPLFSADKDRPGFLNAPFEGLVSGSRSSPAVGIIAFLLLVGGAFGIVMRSGCVDRGLRALIGKAGHDPILVFPLLFVLFSLGGAVFGMGEEVIPFVILLAPVVVRLGYDSITALLMTYVASQLGFAASWMNPFSVAIAQSIAGLDLLSGAAFRIALWLVYTAVGIAFMLWWARRVKRDPEKSPVHASDTWFREQDESRAGDGSFTLRDGVAIAMIALGMVWVVWGVVVHEYFIAEIAGQFFAIGMVIGLMYLLPGQHRMSGNRLAVSFREGAVGLAPVVLVVGFAKGIVIILGGTDPSQPAVMNTILYAMAWTLQGVPELLSAWLMLGFQSLINFMIPSGSGQAALTMPLMAPLGDLVGVTRQVSVLAFQLGDGLLNLLVPTSAKLMGVLGAARVDWAVWARWLMLPLGLFLAMAMAALALAVAIGYS
ncbi:MAG TPA: putative basic amino acid antiporter YfcC [Xanthomonadaceae bacterium]|nr:putative basic amino acid antiporter YfcC [Xanthomonadaceae bacterium]